VKNRELYFQFIFFFLSCLLASSVHANILDELKVKFRFQKSLHSKNLSNLVTKDIAQDEEGYIWIATSDGLNRYDGENNSIYRPSRLLKNSLSHFSINCLFVDSSGTLWVGSKGGLDKYNAELDIFESFTLTLKPDIKNIDSTKLNVVKIFEDSKKRLWIGTRNHGVILVSADRLSNEVIDIESNQKELHTPLISDIIETSDGLILIAAKTGLFQFRDDRKKIKRIDSNNKSTSKALNNITIKLLELEPNKILIGTAKGIFLFDLKNDSYLPILPETFSKTIITAIKKIDGKNVLLGTRRSGLYLYNVANMSTVHFENKPSDKYSLVDNQIYSIFQSKDNRIWIATNLGTNIVDLQQQVFGHIKLNDNYIECLSGNTIYAILADSFDNLWIGAFGQTLHKVDINTGECTKFSGKIGDSENNILKYVVSLYEDEYGDIWIGTLKAGVIKYEKNTNTFQKFDKNSYNNSELLLKAMTAITGNGKGKIWLATYNKGLFEFDFLDKTLKNIVPSTEESSGQPVKAINGLVYDKNDNLWIATDSEGLWKLDAGTKQMKRVITKKSARMELPDALFSVNLDDRNHLWVGSQGKGAYRYDLKSGEVINYSIDSGLLSNVVMNIQQDNQGDIWFITDKGLTRLSEAGNRLDTFLENDGLQADAFTTAGFFDSERELLFTGGINGFNHFSPKAIRKSSVQNKAVITSFELFYSPVKPSSDSPLKKVIGHTNRIELSYEQSVFAFSFSGLEFLNPEQINYRFMLEGYDTDWNTVSSDRRYANYTNISPGNYIFKVKASNKYGAWVDNETKVRINIAFPWWQTNLAYISFVLLSIFSIYILVMLRTKSLTERSKQLEQCVTERTEELAQEKQKVEQLLSNKNEEFANVSHEFRTPLTLILGPLSQVLKTNKNPEEISRLNIVQRNGYRLLRMVDQLLNLETFRVKSITQKSSQATGRTVKLLAEAFVDLANDKGIELHIGKMEDINFEFTNDALEKIVVNLLSNATKYTPAGKKINIHTARTPNNELLIRIEDTGIGIPADKIDSIFERYNRVLDENSEQVTGAGIGLALVKSLVEAHNGIINIESEVGVGTTVAVILPIINEVDESEVKTHANQEIIAMELMGITGQATTSTEESKMLSFEPSNDKPSVLVIEDNQDMRNYIVEQIKDDYQVLTAKDGLQGFNLAVAEVPDLIISDIMMPNKDGYQLTYELRQNSIANHIPIILLTARDDRESRLKGWYEQADEYLTKPFDVEELKIRLNNLLGIRNILKKRFSELAFQTNTLSSNETKLTTTVSEINEHREQLQEKFINRLNRVLEKHYLNSDVAVSTIASDLAMSERQLLRKSKSIVDMTPIDYLRRFRIEKGRKLLEQGKSASYATVEIGFTSQSYFGKCFKAQYGVSPRQYKKALVE